LGEAATLEPREARYRAYYGSALTRRSTSRRAAETELQAALSLDPDNPTFRFMLAEFYQAIGLRRRAQTELSRVLAVDPRNEAARNLMATLSKA
jgi:predicted Zn-dependent protease